MLYTGVDWADQKHDALALDETGRKLSAIRVPHTTEGLAKLDTWLSSLLGDQDKEQMACIIETNHGLLIAFLLEHGWPVYPVNPRTVDRKRGASGAKTDEIDAYLLAKTGRADFADLHRLIPDSEKVAELKGLTRDQDSLIQMQTRLVNQLTACLKDYYPVALDLFARIAAAFHSARSRKPIPPWKQRKPLRLNRSVRSSRLLVIPAPRKWPPRFSNNCISLVCEPTPSRSERNRAWLLL